MMLKLTSRLLLLASLWSGIATANLSVPVYFTSENGPGKLAGTVLIQETPYGLLFTPNLKGLNPGIHGFHIHENPSCAKNGSAAGSHFDPQKTGKHLGPYNDNGHLGDLPPLYVKKDGSSTLPVLAPRLKKIEEINNRSLMVHEGSDNYRDVPEKLGGGGHRMACGVISQKKPSQ